MAMSKSKEELITFKSKHQMPLTITKTDVIPLANKAWNKSFAREEENRNALADRGWFPMNYCLLTNQEILLTKPKDSEEGELNNGKGDQTVSILKGLPTFALDVSALNTQTGPVASQIDKLLSASTRELSKARRKRNCEEGQEHLAKMDQSKRLTAGKAFPNSLQLSQPAFLNWVTESNQAASDSIEKKKRDAIFWKAELHSRVWLLCAKQLPSYMEWTKDELGTMLQYYKIRDDAAMAKDIAGRQAQWLQQKDRIVDALLTHKQINNILNQREIKQQSALTLPVDNKPQLCATREEANAVEKDDGIWV